MSDFAPPTAETFLSGSGLAGLFVGVGVRVLREVLPSVLAPNPSTRLSRNLTLLASVALGVGLGLAGVGVQVVDGVTGWVLGGVGIGALTYVAAGALPEAARLDTVGRVGRQGGES
jgi:hypothetical protein